MRLVQFKENNQVKLGLKTKEGIINVDKTVKDSTSVYPSSIEEVIEMGDDAKQLLSSISKDFLDSIEYVSEENIEYQPVISKPEKIICVGLNYHSHVEESKMDLPEEPVLFSKFNNALASHNQKITLPNTAEKYDYEAELVMVVGKEGENIKKEDALSHVFGYSIGNDFSARDLQMRSGQWLIGKTLKNFAPIGPDLLTADEIDPSNLAIECKVNGEVRQSSNTSKMIFDCSTLISYISQYIKLKPGDIIFSGTPEGVILGYEEKNQKWLTAGDVVEVRIDKLGTLKNELV